MTIRPLRPEDVPRLKALEGEHVWEFGDDFLNGLVIADEEDKARMFVGAWRRAEVHLVVDPVWSTPGARMAALGQLHQTMELQLKAQGVGQAVTWFAGTERFVKRLLGFGWVRSCNVSFLKVLR